MQDRPTRSADVHRLAMLVLMLAMLAACTASGATTPSPAVTPDACDLLTEEIAQAALGGRLGGPDRRAGANLCEWGDRDTLNLIFLTVINGAGFDTAKSNAGTAVTIAPVEGLGDDAFFFTSELTGTQLYVTKGQVAFEVHLRAPTFSAALAESTLREAAQLIVSRL